MSPGGYYANADDSRFGEVGFRFLALVHLGPGAPPDFGLPTQSQSFPSAQNRSRKGRGPCYQTCYHFLQKAARNRTNQEPTRWIMSLKYKAQHEGRRNINQTHNPKVEGSNPSPATNSFQNS